VDEIQGVQVKL